MDSESQEDVEALQHGQKLSKVIALFKSWQAVGS